jgi:hypothetical protein
MSRLPPTSRCVDCADRVPLNADGLCLGCIRLRRHKVLQLEMRALVVPYPLTCALCCERTAGPKCGLCPAHLEEMYAAGESPEVTEMYRAQVREATGLKETQMACARRAADRFELNPACCLVCGKHCGAAACADHVQQVLRCALEAMDGLCEDRVQAHKHKILLGIHGHHSLCALCDTEIDRGTESFQPFQKLCTVHWNEFDATGCIDVNLARAKASERDQVIVEPVEVKPVPQPVRAPARALSVKDLKQPVKKLTKKQQLALAADAPREYARPAPKDTFKETPLQRLYRNGTIGFDEYAQRREPDRWNNAQRTDLSDSHAKKRKIDEDDVASRESMLAACTPVAIELLDHIARIKVAHPRFCNRHDLQPKLGLYPWEIVLREFHFVVAQSANGMVADDQREGWAALPDELKAIRPEQCRRTRMNMVVV